VSKKSRDVIFSRNKSLRAAAQHRTGPVNNLSDAMYIICVIYVICVHVHLRKLDSSFSKISSHELPNEGGVWGLVGIIQGRGGIGHRNVSYFNKDLEGPQNTEKGPGPPPRQIEIPAGSGGILK
jgi:hypothetical protein